MITTTGRKSLRWTHSFGLAVVLCCFADPRPIYADAYADARGELIAAYQANDTAAMRVAAGKALAARPGYPGALFNRAFAEALDGDASAALATLQGLADSGVDFDVAEADEFVALRDLPEWAAFEATIAALREPVGEATVAYSHDETDFVPEGIVIDNDGTLYLGSIRHGTIVSIDSDNSVRPLADGPLRWSVFGMRLDGDGGLWIATSAVPEFATDLGNARGQTGLIRFDLASGVVSQVSLLPESGEAQVLGDLVIVDAETILATESLTGALYRYSISSGEFTELVGPGPLRSMQGLVLDSSGEHLYVADYVGGLFRIDLADNSVSRVAGGDNVSLFGIDGLYRYGDELIAIQNGIRPNRVVGLNLSDDGLSITDSRVLARNLPEFDEPTLGQVVGDDFFFVANSHWNRFDRDGNLADGLSGPIVLKFSLR